MTILWDGAVKASSQRQTSLCVSLITRLITFSVHKGWICVFVSITLITITYNGSAVKLTDQISVILYLTINTEIICAADPRGISSWFQFKEYKEILFIKFPRSGVLQYFRCMDHQISSPYYIFKTFINIQFLQWKICIIYMKLVSIKLHYSIFIYWV